MYLSAIEAGRRVKRFDLAPVLTGHAGFDKQSDIIATGNIFTNTLTGTFVRPVGETTCNAHTFEPGHLRKADLKYFEVGGHSLPAIVARWIAQHPDDSLILYRFRTWRGRKETVHGWLITDRDYRLRTWFHTGPTRASAAIVEAMKPFLSWHPDDYPDTAPAARAA